MLLKFVKPFVIKRCMGVFFSSTVRTMSQLEEPVKFKTATFAMGCFWHPDALFGCQKGVYRTRVGYTSGKKLNPTYRDLGDHTEATEIDYNEDVIRYEDLLKLFWKNTDLSESSKRQYRSAIFYRDEEEQRVATESKKEAEKSFRKSVPTAIEPFEKFYPAEDYHQKYYLQTHHTKLFNGLGIRQKDLMNSQLAAKLNGYVVGENTVGAFNAECDKFGLLEENLDYVRKMIAKGKQAHC